MTDLFAVNASLTAFKDAPGIDLTGCKMIIASCGLMAGERGSVWPEAWPGPVKKKIKDLVEEWTKANPQHELALASTGHANGACFLILHYREKAAA